MQTRVSFALALMALATFVACGAPRARGDDDTDGADGGTSGGNTRVVKTCGDFSDDCPAGYECQSGLCATPSQVACVLTTTENDGCDSSSVCKNAGERGNACFGFPACPANGICPVGEHGAMCNDGSFAGKDRVCVPGACTKDQHCPQGQRCLLANPGDKVGSCSSAFSSRECNGDGTCWDSAGCPVTPGSQFPGTGAPGDACDLVSGPDACRPVCCPCTDALGAHAVMVASCDFDHGKCATAAEACAAFQRGTSGSCR